MSIGGERREVNIKVSYKSSDVEIDMDENKSGWVSLSSLLGLRLQRVKSKVFYANEQRAHKQIKTHKKIKKNTLTSNKFALKLQKQRLRQLQQQQQHD